MFFNVIKLSTKLTKSGTKMPNVIKTKDEM